MPSPKILERKKSVVKALAEELKQAQSIVLTDYMGLNVEQDTEMRADLREAGVTYRVVKNTVASRAFEQLGIPGFEEELKGPTALAYSTVDVVLAPRLCKKYVDKFKKIEIKGGVLEGQPIDLNTVNQLANIPAPEVLYGQLVSSLMFPISSLAMTLNAIAKKAEEAGVEEVSALAGQAAAANDAAEAADAEAEVKETTEEVKAEAAEEAKAEETAEAEPAAEETAAADTEA